MVWRPRPLCAAAASSLARRTSACPWSPLVNMAPLETSPMWGAVVLAAGASSRMGQPKLLLPWGDRTVLGHILRTWRQLGVAQLSVVCAPGGHILARELDLPGFPIVDRIVNVRPQDGMFSSIRAAARWPGWSPRLSHVAVVLGDQPQVSMLTLRRVVEFAAAHPTRITQPSRCGRRRHPVILPWPQFASLAERERGTMKDYLAERADCIECCELDDPALDLDLDTPADYAKALTMFPPRGL